MPPTPTQLLADARRDLASATDPAVRKALKARIYELIEELWP